jgi:hypothetical protein
LIKQKFFTAAFEVSKESPKLSQKSAKKIDNGVVFDLISGTLWSKFKMKPSRVLGSWVPRWRLIAVLLLLSQFGLSRVHAQSTDLVEYYYNINWEPDGAGDYTASGGGHLELKLNAHPTNTTTFIVQVQDFGNNQLTSFPVSVAANQKSDQTISIPTHGAEVSVLVGSGIISQFYIGPPPCDAAYVAGAAEWANPGDSELSTVFSSMRMQQFPDNGDLVIHHHIQTVGTTTVKWIPKADGHMYFKYGGFEGLRGSPEWFPTWNLKIDLQTSLPNWDTIREFFVELGP